MLPFLVFVFVFSYMKLLLLCDVAQRCKVKHVLTLRAVFCCFLEFEVAFDVGYWALCLGFWGFKRLVFV